MKKIDIIIALLAGEGVAWLVFGLLREQGIGDRFLIWILAVLLPIFAVFGLWVGYLLGKKFLWVFQATKFFLIGVLATLVDLGILNILISISGIVSGVFYSVFKGISFIVATFSKYWGNKFWAFEKIEKTGMGKEFGQFFIITLIGLGINVGIASFLVNTFGSQFGLTAKTWANIGAIIAAVITAAWNFLGYKFIVFKK